MTSKSTKPADRGGGGAKRGVDTSGGRGRPKRGGGGGVRGVADSSSSIQSSLALDEAPLSSGGVRVVDRSSSIQSSLALGEASISSPHHSASYSRGRGRGRGIGGTNRSSNVPKTGGSGSAGSSRGRGVVSANDATSGHSASRLPAPQFAQSREQLPMDPTFARANAFLPSSRAINMTSSTPRTNTAPGNPSYNRMAAQTPNNIPFSLLLEQEVPQSTYGGDRILKRKASAEQDLRGQYKRPDIGISGGGFQAHSQNIRNSRGRVDYKGKTTELQKRTAAEAEIESFYNGQPRGKDGPDGTIMHKVNESKKAVMVLNGKNILNIDQTVVERGVKLRYGINNSQNPSLIIQTAEYEVEKDTHEQYDLKKIMSIFREHMRPFQAGSSENLLFKREYIDADHITLENIHHLITSAFNMNIQAEAAKEIMDAVTADLQLQHGLEFFGIHLVTGAIIYNNSKLADTINDYTSRGFVNMLFIRSTARASKALDNFWETQLNSCMGGAYPFYRPSFGDVQKLKFVDLHNRIVKGGDTLEFPYWLAPIPKPVQYIVDPDIGPIKEEDEENTIVESCPALTKYESLADMQYRPSIGLIRDSQKKTENDLNFYCHNKAHLFTVKAVSHDRVIVGVTINGFVGVGLAPLPSDSVMVKRWVSDPVPEIESDSNPAGEQAPPAVSTTEAPTDIQDTPRGVLDLEIAARALALDVNNADIDTEMIVNAECDELGVVEDRAPEWSATMIMDDAMNDSSHFFLSIEMDEESVKGFEVGKDYKMSILSLSSVLSTNRQLRAVSWASRRVSRDHPHFEIQQFLMGTSNVSTCERLVLQCKDDDTAALVRLYYQELGLNKAQKEAVTRVFTGNETGVIVQGPPGTGKSVTNSTIGIMCGLFKFNCLLSAPTNLATEALMDKMIGQYENIQRKPWGKANNVGRIFNLIYFRSMVTTRDSLLRKPSRGTLHQYEHATYIENLIEIDAGIPGQEATSPAQQDAREWLSLRATVVGGGSVPLDKVEAYSSVINAAARRVFKHGSKPFVVVSTCNNSAQLKDWRVAVKVVTVDEVAFALEADVWICASLGPDKLVLTGDNEQLSPHVSSRGMNEHYHTIKQDAYTRLDRAYLLTGGKQGGDEVFYDVVTRLDTNYRMHPRVCELPALLSYPWLACAANTRVESPCYLAMKDFWESPVMKPYRDGRLAPQSGLYQQGERDCRRLAFDTVDSYSAPAEGQTSLRNFGTSNAITAIFQCMVAYNNTKPKRPIDPSWILCGTPYTGQQSLMQKQWRLRMTLEEFVKMVKLGTFDKLQGVENRWMILEITNANKFNPALVGFLNDFKRGLVALTRAMDGLWLFGSFSHLFQQIHVFEADKHKRGLRSWGMLFADILNRGDLVSVGWTPKNVAANSMEAAKHKEEWTGKNMEMSEADSRFKSKVALEAVALAKKVGIEKANADAWSRLNKELDQKLTVWRKREAAWVDTFKEDIDRAKADAEFQEEVEAARLQNELDKKAENACKVQVADGKLIKTARKPLQTDGGQFAPLADQEDENSANDDYAPAY